MTQAIGPILDWEVELWPIFDRLKSAFDRQDQARRDGKMSEFLIQAQELFDYLENLTFQSWMKDKDKAEYVFLSWKASRGINSWLPDRDLPLRWFLAERVPVPVPTAEAMAAIKAKYDGWKTTRKENAKRMKAELKQFEKAKKAWTKKKKKETTNVHG